MACTVLRCSDPKAHWVIDLDTRAPSTSRAQRATAVCQRHYLEMTSGDVEWVWQVDQETGSPSYGRPVVLLGEDLRRLNQWVVEDFVSMNQPLDEAASTPDGRLWAVVLKARRRGDSQVQELKLVITEDQWRTVQEQF
jgi:hypothetical protein